MSQHDRRVSQRHYGLDWLRIGAFGLLILHHIGMYFAPGTWLVKAPDRLEWITWPMLLVQPWRMPLLFLVSGFATYATMTRNEPSGSFFRRRSIRLLMPLVLGLLLINPPQMWVFMTENRAYRGDLLHFWAYDWLSFRSVSGVFLPHAGHLWFLCYLWFYTTLLLIVRVLAPGLRAPADKALEWLEHGSRLAWAPLALLCVIRLGLLFTVPEEHGVLHDWVSDLHYVPAFLFGFALAARSQLWRAVERVQLRAAALALSCYVVLVLLELAYPGGGAKPHLPQAIDREARLIMAWGAILLLLGAAHRFLRRDHPLRAKLGRMIFPSYVIHQPIIVVVGWTLLPFALPASASFAIILACTIAGCWLFSEAGWRSGVLAPVFGLPRRAPNLHGARPTLLARRQPGSNEVQSLPLS